MMENAERRLESSYLAVAIEKQAKATGGELFESDLFVIFEQCSVHRDPPPEVANLPADVRSTPKLECAWIAAQIGAIAGFLIQAADPRPLRLALWLFRSLAPDAAKFIDLNKPALADNFRAQTAAMLFTKVKG